MPVLSQTRISRALVFVITLAVAPSAFAQTTTILAVTPTPSAPANHLEVFGANFVVNAAGPSAVTLGGYPATFAVASDGATNDQLTIEIPAEIIVAGAGTYQLKVSQSAAAGRTAIFEVALPAIAAAGPQGDPGPQGLQGPPGAVLPVLGTLQTTDAMGSGGAPTFTSDCPAGSVATGMGVAPFSFVITAYQMRCRAVSLGLSVSAGLASNLSATVSTTATAGGQAGLSTLDCPAGMVVNGLTGKLLGSYLSELQLKCRQAFGGAGTGTSPVFQASTFGSGGAEVTCPAGTVATGFSARVSMSLADGVSLRCQ